MTVKDMMTNDQRKVFIKWGIKAKIYGTIGRIFKSRKHLDKSVEYLDKRWRLMTAVLHEHGYIF